jgi:uncharacterized cupin superfamily protein
MARREHQLWASGVPGWVGTVRFCVQEEGWIIICKRTPPSPAPFDTTLSPHRRITAASLCAAFAHIYGEAGTSALGIWSARLGRNGPVLCAGGGVDFICKRTPPSPAPFHTAPSPHRRITAPSLCAAFAHIHGEAGTSALGIWSARVGRNGPVLCAGGGWISYANAPPHSLASFDTAPVSAQANHCTSFVRGLRPHPWRGGNISFGHLECQGGSERSGSVCRRRGGFHICKHAPPHSLAPFDTALSPHRRITAPRLCAAFAHIYGEAGTSALGIWSARVGRNGPVLCAGGGVDFICKHPPILAPFDTALSPHRRITAPSLCAAFAHIHGEAGTSALGIWSARVGRNGPVLCAGGGVDFICNAPPHSLASFDTAPSPHRRITAPSLCAAFAHIHGEAGTSALGIWSARVGQNGPVLCAGGGVDFICKRTPHSLALSTLPCLRTGESLHLVCARPSPTSMARREHQLWASGVPGWV